jgi:hypothetical protein
MCWMPLARSSIDLVVDGRFMGIVAASEREADAALAQLQEQVAWRESASLPDMHALADFLRMRRMKPLTPFKKGKPRP